MPSKKKKYNARFPPARIKKIMQTDDEIGKVAAAVPVLISKGLEMFLTSILVHTGEVTKAKRAKTMTTSHLKECILNVGMFDFLKQVVIDVPDMQNEQEPSTSSGMVLNEESKKLIRKRSSTAAKPPKKMKLSKGLDHASEENETTESGSIDSQDSMDDHNGLLAVSSRSPSMSHLSHSPVWSDNPDHKPSFHIPLDDLMAPDSEPVLSTDRVLLIDAPESGMNTRTPETFPQSDFSSRDKKLPATSNGFSSPQNPMDLSLNTQKIRENVLETNVRGHESVADTEPSRNTFQPTEQQRMTQGSSKAASSSISHVDQSGTQPSTLNPLIMPHLYNPISALPPAAADSAAPGPTPDLTAKIPQGGMLSFLYSNLSADSFSEMSSHPLPNVIPTSAHSDPHHHHHDTSKQSVADKSGFTNAAYPYNPVTQHRTDTSPVPPYPYMPEALRMQNVNATIKSSQSQSAEDDDYDA